MRIGLVSPYPFKFPGGVNEHIKGLYEFLKSKGHDVKILAPRHNKKEDYGKDFLLFGRDIPFPFNASTSYASFELNMKNLKKTLEKENFDILHFHDIGIFLPIQILNLSKAKNILTLHSLPDASLIYRVSSDILKWAEKPVSDSFTSVIATSKPVRKVVREIYKGPTYIIPNAIDLEKFNPRVKKIKKFLDGKINILFVGRFDKRKGLDYLMNAFVELKKTNGNIRLIVVGSGDRKYYENFVKKNNLEDVVFAGYVKDVELPRYYATCDIFCAPSIYGEGFGIILLEAMASKKPIAAFANSGYKQVITGLGKKFLAKPKNTRDLTKALQNLVENKKLREKMGEWGLKQVEKYSWENVGKEILKVYENVLSKE